MICALLTEAACEFWPVAANSGSSRFTCGSCFSCAVFPHSAGAAQRCRLAPAPVPVAHWPQLYLPWAWWHARLRRGNFVPHED